MQSLYYRAPVELLDLVISDIVTSKFLGNTASIWRQSFDQYKEIVGHSTVQIEQLEWTYLCCSYVNSIVFVLLYEYVQ